MEYHAITEEAMLDGVRKGGMPESAAHYLAMLYQAVRNGWMATITKGVQKTMGRPPVSFKDFARENAALWR